MLVGKISRRVSLVHYPEPKEVEELNPDKIRQLHVTSSGASMPNHRFASSGQSSWRRNSQSTLEHSSYTQSSRYKSFSPEGGEPSKHSKRRRAHEPNHSTDHSLGRNSEVTSLGSSERSHQEKLKRKGKSWVRLLPARLLSLYYSRAASCGYAVIFKSELSSNCTQDSCFILNSFRIKNRAQSFRLWSLKGWSNSSPIIDAWLS